MRFECFPDFDLLIYLSRFLSYLDFEAENALRKSINLNNPPFLLPTKKKLMKIKFSRPPGLGSKNFQTESPLIIHLEGFLILFDVE